VLWRGEPLDAAIERAFRHVVLVQDRGLARAIVGAVLRHLPDLDALIDSATGRPLGDDARARMVLRMALAQTLELQTPPHAVIATALALLEGGPRRLLHGVLSTLLKRGVALPDPPTLPPFWRARWGEALAADAARALACEPPLDLTLRDADATPYWTATLGGTSLWPGHVRLAHKGRVEELPGYGEGAWWVQDLAASLPARLLGAAAGDHVVDLCAAPGGKTMQFAAAGARVTAVERSQKRAARIAENLQRTRLAAEIVVADALAWRPAAAPDAILLDAPCSASGTFRRHPDVLYGKSERQIAGLAEQQARLLDHACTLLRPGGMLVYCVCSLERDEGEAQADALLGRRDDMTTLPIALAEIPAGLRPDQNGWLRTGPGDLVDAGGLDGFFIARLWKRPA
jgi:16S rRNA (cytosine967-C5)-methyltransferase